MRRDPIVDRAVRKAQGLRDVPRPRQHFKAIRNGRVGKLRIAPQQDGRGGIDGEHRFHERLPWDLPRRRDQDDHPLGPVLRFPDDQVTQLAFLLMGIVRRDLLPFGPGPDRGQERSRLGAGEMAFLQVQDLVPAPLRLHPQLQPSPRLGRVHIPEAELHLVAVVPGRGSAQDGKGRKPLDAFQGRADLFLLIGELGLVGAVLKGAPAAGPEVPAAGGGLSWRT